MTKVFVLCCFVYLNLGAAFGQPTLKDEDSAYSCSCPIQQDVGNELRMFKSDVLDLIQSSRKTDDVSFKKLENVEAIVKSIQEQFESHNRQTNSTQVGRILNSLQSQITDLIATVVALRNETCSQSTTNVSKTEIKSNGGIQESQV